ncbi:Hypothetical protein R9X50_00415300 [Acrodontium crateriforme]|uniref:Zn(2)-C6 fungal-type domain-containing protein n=1 Tax=Acrodontium crateriforme TaxID=150365 RepID=A0AAQ3M4S7_9PEZI|nr:Hypothetical protein R9X50_00415300 [Acrodontium crateriforme]
MPSEERQSRSEQGNPDSACTRCRERKIRCGRERPCCSNCERDTEATCIYQTPVKRVNHLKLLCDSVDLIQDRLKRVESNFARLNNTLSGAAETNRPVSRSSSSRLQSRNSPSIETDSSSEEDDDLSPTQLLEVHVFRNQADKIDRFHGSSSLFVLCNQLRLQILQSQIIETNDTALSKILLDICEAAGEAETFQITNEQASVRAPSKQQVLGAIGHFFQHVDYTTDIFVPENLLANVERIYSEPSKPHDEAWITCFRAIVLLVLGREVSHQSSNALFGDFARDLLPNRAALVNSCLLTSPRLINIQALLLVSLAAEQFDPVGWDELIFTHACMLARTMGLHHTKYSALESNDVDTVERHKVFCALYARDRSLCILRGRLSWMSSDEYNITSQLGIASTEGGRPYNDRYRLTGLQDEIHRLSTGISLGKLTSQSKIQTRLRVIEARLDEFANDSTFLQATEGASPVLALMPLEFLASRILALQYGIEERHKTQVLSDARASCLLLLIACGEQDRQLLDQLNSLHGPQRSDQTPVNEISGVRKNASFFKNALDSFSVPAFFVLLNRLLQSREEEEPTGATPDIDLLRKVSAVYKTHAGGIQAGSYHGKLAQVFGRLLAMAELLNDRPELLTSMVSSTNELRTQSMSVPTLKTHQNKSSTNAQAIPQSVVMRPEVPVASFPTPPSPTITWENWLSAPSMNANVPASMAVITPPSVTMGDYTNDVCPEFFAQILGSPIGDTSDAMDTMQWGQPAGSIPLDSSRKRRRTIEEPHTASVTRVQGSPVFEEVPFHLIS